MRVRTGFCVPLICRFCLGVGGRRISLAIRTFTSPQLLDERGAVDTEEPCRFRAVALGLLERAVDERPLVLRQLGVEVDAAGRQSLQRCALVAHLGGQIPHIQHAALGEHHGPADDVAQLADVARPGISGETLEERRRDASDGLAELLVCLAEEVLDEQRDILDAIAERHEMQPDAVEPVEQVLPEPTLLHQLGRVTVGGRDDADVDGRLRVRTDPPDGNTLENAEQLRLQRERHVPDLVEEQRSTLRLLEHPAVMARRAGERSLGVPEEFALGQLGRDCRAVHGHEGASAPALLVDELRQELLPGAGLAGDEHDGDGQSDHLRLLHRAHEFGVVTHNAGAVLEQHGLLLEQLHPSKTDG